METIVSDKYQVVVPKDIRKSMGLKQGQKIHWIYLTEDMAVIKPEKKENTSHTERLRGLGKRMWKGIDPQKYIDELRDEWTDWEKEHGII